ncbi:hypothetical protein PMZ80_003251 [Knufia obscura]|uniref:Uncharacterized protein n=1 Tax=Knufia obscura TaxID=1635080 RepID=A0ABR0RUN5_9EURO|nr:hypothetical protein PMZ80_003251 [Knufia obscura]
MSGPYAYEGQVDCSVAVDRTQCKGKSVVVTGGAQGIGEAYVRGFVSAGAFVTFCDINEEQGRKLADELGPEHVCFVKADTRSWEDQTRMFEAAVTKSPYRSVDIVIANAGVGRGSGDPMMALEDPNTIPTKPSMHIIDINLIGVMYSLKLAIHYFRRSPSSEDRDRLYIRTVIQSQEVYESIRAKGLDFATTESCLAAVMRIACDKRINGHSFAIVPESVAKEGFIDLDEDDFEDQASYLFKFQNDVVKLRGDAWT